MPIAQNILLGAAAVLAVGTAVAAVQSAAASVAVAAEAAERERLLAAVLEERERRAAAERADSARRRKKEAPSDGDAPVNIFFRGQIDILFDSLLRLKQELVAAAPPGLGLRLPALGDAPPDAGVLAALLLWGDVVALTELFLAPTARGHSTALFDADAARGVAFSLSTLSPAAAERVVAWLLRLSGLRPAGAPASPALNVRAQIAGRLRPDLDVALLQRLLTPPGADAYVAFVEVWDLDVDNLARYAAVAAAAGVWITRARHFLLSLDEGPQLHKRYARVRPLRGVLFDAARIDTLLVDPARVDLTNPFRPEAVVVANFDVQALGFCARHVTRTRDGASFNNALFGPKKPSRTLFTPRAAVEAARDAAVASVVAAHRARLLLHRVTSPSGAPHRRLVGASFEHCAVVAGEAGMLSGDRDVVGDMKATDADLLHARAADVAAALTAGLASAVPPPDTPTGDGRQLLDVEIAGFVSALLKVLKLRLASTPVTALGEPPSSFVPHGGGLDDITYRGVLMSRGASTAALAASVAARQAERDAQRTEAAALPPWAAPAVAGFVAVFVASAALSTAAVVFHVVYWHSPLPLGPQGTSLVAGVAAALAAVAGAVSVLLPLRDFLRVRSRADWPDAVRRGYRFGAATAAALGVTSLRPAVATAAEAAEAEAHCRASLRVWGARLLRARLHAARRAELLPRVTALALMDDVAALCGGDDERVVSEEADGPLRRRRVVEGALPADVTDADWDAFLAQRVADDDGAGAVDEAPASVSGALGGGGGSGAGTLAAAVTATLQAAADAHEGDAESRFVAVAAAVLGLAAPPAMLRDDGGGGAAEGAAAAWRRVAGVVSNGGGAVGDAEVVAREARAERHRLADAARRAAREAAGAADGVVGSGGGGGSSGATMQLPKPAPPRAAAAPPPVAPASASASASAPRHATVEDALREGGWELVRHRKHRVYRRVVFVPAADSAGGVDGAAAPGVRHRQTFVASSTPSTPYAGRLQRGTLRRLEQHLADDRRGAAAPPPPPGAQQTP